MSRIGIAAVAIAFGSLAWLVWSQLNLPDSGRWSQQELALLAGLSLSNLPGLPTDPSNAVADDPRAADLGHRLYFDSRLSGNGQVACATCHQPSKYFTDGLALAVGSGVGDRHTPSLVGLSYSPWFYWDGRKDSQWAQALAPIEAGHEHNLDRVGVLRVLGSEDYRAAYEELFGELPDLSGLPVAASPLGNEPAQAAWKNLNATQQRDVDKAFSNAGKALAAYQRKLQPGRSRFDDYIDAVLAGQQSNALSNEERAGLRLFINKGQCVTCHNGPLLTNNDFHNTGVPPLPGNLPPMGRYDGIRTARLDPFGCLGQFSDAGPSECLELRFASDSNELVGAHKTPTLRNVAETAPYMHAGQFDGLEAVMRHYNDAPVSMLSHNEAKPLGLRPVQLRQLVALMHSLTAPLATDPSWLVPPPSNP